MIRSRGGGHSVQGNRGSSGSEPSQRCEVNALMETKSYACTTKHEEMSRQLAARGIQIPNFVYDFSIVEGLSRLSDTTDGKLSGSFTRVRNKGNPIRELCQKKGKDSAATAGDVVATIIIPLMIPSPPGSPPPPRLLTEDIFGVIVQHGPPEGSMKFMFTGGETQTLFSWREHLGVQKFPYCPTKVNLTKAIMVSVGLVEGIDKDEVRRMGSENAYQSTMGTWKGLAN
ncbi:hypothetical protein PVK06_027052 [Gossypium arboreum]|uniref:Uncharacterized protein n=1 Tax=Gossypium arboreum TaxID=29729 RepID=A0ABR0NZB3_GOSAR|nr:hypothetical protein PVK06_027052 [Gossypium arboreum]